MPYDRTTLGHVISMLETMKSIKEIDSRLNTRVYNENWWFNIALVTENDILRELYRRYGLAILANKLKFPES